jgi:4-amino-4-deoxy-L-arabinose transferase-like glycosyltransferase
LKDRDLRRALVVLVTLLGFAVRVSLLDYHPLRGDESFGIQFAAHSWRWLLSYMSQLEPLPPLYYPLLHFWMQIAGQSEFAARFLSLLFGVSCLPLTYLLGKLLGRSTVGAFSAFLMAISPFQIWHAQDVRNYTLWVALSLAAVVSLLRALQHNRWRYWAGYAGMTLLSLYSHYFELFILFFHNLFFLLIFLGGRWHKTPLAESRRRLLETWVVIQATLIVLYAPSLAGAASISVHYQATGSSPALWELFCGSFAAAVLSNTAPGELVPFALPVVLCLALVGLAYAWKRDRRLALFLGLYIAVPSLCVFTAAQIQPLYRDQYLIAIAPADFLAISFGVIALRDALPRWKAAPVVAGIALFAVISVSSLYNYHWSPLYQKSPDWRALTDYLETETQRDDVIILNYPDPTFFYYYDGDAGSFILPSGFLTEETRAETAETLRVLAEKYSRIWFYPLQDVRWDNEGFVESWLDRHGSLLEQRDLFGFRWLIYSLDLVSAEQAQHSLAFRLGPSVWLRGFDSGAVRGDESPIILAQPGEAFTLTLYWEAVEEVETSYTVFVHLVDAHDCIWSQRDSLPQGGDFPTDAWFPGDVIVDPYSIVVPVGAPPGDYQLVAGMYEPTIGQRLPVFDAQGASLGDRANLARVTVE